MKIVDRDPAADRMCRALGQDPEVHGSPEGQRKYGVYQKHVERVEALRAKGIDPMTVLLRVK